MNNQQLCTKLKDFVLLEDENPTLPPPPRNKCQTFFEVVPYHIFICNDHRSIKGKKIHDLLRRLRVPQSNI